MAARRLLGKVFAASAALVMIATGCTVVKGTISTLQALDRAGFGSPGMDSLGGDTYVVTVSKDTEDLNAAATDAAGVVWRNLPFRIERLEVKCGNGFGGTGTFTADRSELENRFGSRDPDLDRGLQRSDLRTVAGVIAAVVIGGLILLAGIVILIVVLIRRSRRRGPPPGTWGGPPGWETRGPQPPPPGYGPRP